MASFIHDESGSAMVDWIVIMASAAGLTLAAIGLLDGNGGSRSIHLASHTNSSAATFDAMPADLSGAPTIYDGAQTRNTGDAARIPDLMSDLSDLDLRNLLTTWAARAADPSHVYHEEAADQVAALILALEARGLEP